MDRLKGNEIFLRAKKNGGDVFAWIPDWLRDRLKARERRFGRRPFMVGNSTRLDTVIDTWRQRLANVFELADTGVEKPTPHRFRHTYARILLERGVSVSDVADLLGDDEKTVKTHYGRWVRERQDRLTRILKGAFTKQRSEDGRASASSSVRHRSQGRRVQNGSRQNESSQPT
jgi:integrase